ncbi:hypothetical protein H5410_011726 [Solanum commersonii]|uniref:Uncharacterized protein n=1 Tax=Solanum commersonii TaxID=4109 RepID=A0A9J6AQ76_SOLCO|nr:hypothetical protein H5410_011726 [Solanum commersonii]
MYLGRIRLKKLFPRYTCRRKKYHSGKISKSVVNGSAGSPIIDGSKTAKPTLHAIVPRITTGKIYKRSLGHAARHNNYDPYPLANLALNTGSFKSGPEIPCLRIIGKCININTAVRSGNTKVCKL